jgi:hypothetical protein
LPPAEDSLVFFDVSRLFKGVGDLLQSLAPMAQTTDGTSSGSPDAAAPRLICKVLDDLAIIDHVATVEWTDGYRVFHENVAVLAPDAKSKPLYAILKGGSPITEFQKYIPEEASNFWCSTGVDFVAIYKYALSLLRSGGPDAGSLVDKLETLQRENWKLDIEKDILALLEGKMSFISVGNSWVIMVKVESEEKILAQINRMLEAINKRLGPESPLLISKIDVAGRTGFIQISHPMMIMMGGMQPPIIGTADGYLFIGASAHTVGLCLDTAKGKHPNITQNERWQAEALIPRASKIDSISFTDERNLGTELQQAVGGVTLAIGMMSMAGQNMPPELREMLSTVTPIIAKLGPVVGKLNFYQSSAAYTTFDGKRWHTRGVQNYKKPKPCPKEPPEKEKADKKGKPEKDTSVTEI